MEKSILMFVTVILMFTTGFAQDDGVLSSDMSIDAREKTQFGLKLGGNFSNVFDAEGEEFRADPKFGLATGAFLVIPIGKYLGLQHEILFSQKGFQASGTILGSPYSFTRTTNYIDIPLLFTLKPGAFITFMAGPQYSYLLKQTDVFGFTETSILQETEFDNDNIRKNTFCLVAGTDFHYRHFVLGIRAGFDIFKNTGDGTSTTPRYKNAWYQATLGFRFYS